MQHSGRRGCALSVHRGVSPRLEVDFGAESAATMLLTNAYFLLSHFSIDHIFLISLTTTDAAHFRGVATHDGWATAQLLEALLEQVNDATYYGEVSRSAGVTLHASACAL